MRCGCRPIFATPSVTVTPSWRSSSARPTRTARRARSRASSCCAPGCQAEPGATKEAAMPQQAWNSKRERQYEHIKEGQKQEGRSEDIAEEIAARTVNKQRARKGESEQESKTSTEDISAPRRGGKRSGSGLGGRTRD